MPGIQYGARKTYLSIAQGAIRQTVTEQTEGAIRRDYEMKDGTKGHKFEYVYKSWSGRIIDINVKDGKFGEVCDIEFEDAILSVGTSSRYFMDLVKRLRNANINKTVILTPYDFESDGKKLVGVSVIQSNEKIPNYYWDDVKLEVINGFPVAKFDWKQAKQREKDIYWIDVTSFLVDEVSKIKENISIEKPQQVEDNEMPTNDITDSEVPQASSEMREDEVNIDDVPF